MASISNGISSANATLIDAALGRTSKTVLHDIIGSAFPLAVTGPMGGREGRLVFRVMGYSAASALAALAAAGRCILTAPEQPGLTGMAFYVTDADITYVESLPNTDLCDLTLTVREVA